MHRIFAFLAFLPVLALLSPNSARADPSIIVSSIKLSGNTSHAQITLTVSGRIPVTVFALDQPQRIILDVPEVSFHLPDEVGKTGNDFISAFRFGHFAPGQSRIVFDIVRPALIGEVKVISTVEGAPHRIVIELSRTTREKFLQQVQEHSAKRDKKQETADERLQADSGNKGLPLIVLDPGHGGIDSGALASGGLQEKNLTLAFAKLLRKELEDTGVARVLLTREDDKFIPLRERTQFARAKGAALFISIHADSYSDRQRSPSGATVYTLSEKASDQEAAAYAERENRADEIAGIERPPESNEVADILFDLMQRETKSFSLIYARLLTHELKETAGLNQNPHRSAGFIVLRAPDVPAALFEMGYLSNPHDVAHMQDEAWRQRTAKAAVRAVLAFLEQSQATGTNRGEKK
jgi:N-acetylmuramoyl-L-alanine amidase